MSWLIVPADGRGDPAEPDEIGGGVGRGGDPDDRLRYGGMAVIRVL
ncbi:hypothetical protein [Micromonospora gifhornensis]